MEYEITDRTTKLVIIGDSSVGKSSILMKFTDDIFENHLIATLGIDFRRKNILIKGNLVKLEMWDTSGQEKYKSLTSTFYRGCMGILLVFDLSNRESFKSIESWLTGLKERNLDSVFKFLIGNKSDLSHAVTPEEIKTMKELYGLPYYETSAKTGNNINKIFEEMATKIYDKYFENKGSTLDKVGMKTRNRSLSLKSTDHKSSKDPSGCCK